MLPGLLKQLRGPFAMARWDSAKRQLLLARDHLGQQPFFFSDHNDDEISFGSRIASLLNAGCPRKLDRGRMLDFLQGAFADRSRTFFEGIHRVPPAHLLRFEPGRRSAARFWDPAPDAAAGDDAFWADGFRHHFEQATERALAGASRPCVMLSGGMDSSAVASMAATLRSDVSSFTLLYSGEKDERRWASAVIDEKGLDPIWLDAYSIGPFDEVDDLIRALEEPVEHPGLAVGWAAARRMAMHGCDRVLDGTLGDSAVSYDPASLEVLARGRPLRALREAVLFHRHLYGDNMAPWNFVRRHVVRPFLRLGNSDNGHAGGLDCIHPDLVTSASRAEPVPEPMPRNWHELEQRQIAEVTGAFAMRSLEVRRRIFQGSGLMPGHVYADIDLIQFCLALPWDQRVRHGLTRFVVRQGLKDVLPDAIRRRGGKWSPSGAQLRRYRIVPVGAFDDFIYDGPGPAAGLIDWSVVEAGLDTMRRDPDRFDNKVLTSLWLGFVVKRWMSLFDLGSNQG